MVYVKNYNAHKASDDTYNAAFKSVLRIRELHNAKINVKILEKNFVQSLLPDQFGRSFNVYSEYFQYNPDIPKWILLSDGANHYFAYNSTELYPFNVLIRGMLELIGAGA